MTLVVAIGCTDGVVIAADSASSDHTTGSKQPTQKIYQVGGHPLLCGGSGNGSVLQKIEDSLSTVVTWPTLRELRRQIKQLVTNEQREAIQTHVAYPQQGFHEPPVAITLFAGVRDGVPWIMEIERNGEDTMYDDKLGNFAAIGSGKPWAEAVFRPHLHTERDLELGKIFACRTLEDSIDMAAAGLAKPVHIFTISAEGEVGKVSEEEQRNIVDTCETWRELERETVGSLLSPPEANGGEQDIPEP